MSSKKTYTTVAELHALDELDQRIVIRPGTQLSDEQIKALGGKEGLDKLVKAKHIRAVNIDENGDEAEPNTADKVAAAKEAGRDERTVKPQGKPPQKTAGAAKAAGDDKK